MKLTKTKLYGGVTPESIKSFEKKYLEAMRPELQKTIDKVSFEYLNSVTKEDTARFYKI